MCVEWKSLIDSWLREVDRPIWSGHKCVIRGVSMTCIRRNKWANRKKMMEITLLTLVVIYRRIPFRIIVKPIAGNCCRSPLGAFIIRHIADVLQFKTHELYLFDRDSLEPFDRLLHLFFRERKGRRILKADDIRTQIRAFSINSLLHGRPGFPILRINGDILDLLRDVPEDVCGFGTNGADHDPVEEVPVQGGYIVAAVLYDGSVSPVRIDYRCAATGQYASRVSTVRIDHRYVVAGLYAGRMSTVRIDHRYVAAGLYGDRMSSVRIDDNSMLCICGQTH